MKVRFLTPLATANDSIQQDEVRDLPQAQASQLISHGIAVAVQTDAAPLKVAARRPASAASAV